jgi:hypothetical protein
VYGSAGNSVARITRPTKERKRFIESYIAGRIPTAALLDEARRACQEEEKDVVRASILRQSSEAEETRPATPDLDSLSDNEIDHLYHGTLRKIVSDSRRSSR